MRKLHEKRTLAMIPLREVAECGLTRWLNTPVVILDLRTTENDRQLDTSGKVLEIKKNNSAIQFCAEWAVLPQLLENAPVRLCDTRSNPLVRTQQFCASRKTSQTANGSR